MFIPRSTRPEAGNKYYIRRVTGGYSTAIKGNPTDSLCDTLPNCVGYAVGRFHEIAGRYQFDLIDPVNAENLFANGKQHGLQTGSTPELGALIVWQKGATLSGSDGAGHVAVVEKIDTDGTIHTSESEWKGRAWVQRSYKPPYRYGSAYKLLGFVYQPKGESEMYKGIDVSVHNGDIDWGKVKADGIEFAILRAGFGRLEKQKDEKFEQNYTKAKAAGIPVGAYWYSYAMTPEQAKVEADVFLEAIRGKQFEYPVYYDVEEKKQLALGSEKVSAIIRAFLEKVEVAGYWVGLYTSRIPMQTEVAEDIRTRYALWVAEWNNKLNYNGTVGIWQKSRNGNVTGISGYVDLDECYVNYPEQIKAKGLNGFAPAPTPTPSRITKDVVLEIDGKKYAGTLTEV